LRKTLGLDNPSLSSITLIYTFIPAARLYFPIHACIQVLFDQNASLLLKDFHAVVCFMPARERLMGLKEFLVLMNKLPVIIIAVIIGTIMVFFWLAPGIFSVERTTEDNLTLLHCTGDRFAFIQGTYLYPVTRGEIERAKEAVIQRVKAGGGQGPRAGGESGGGPGNPQVVAWGYCIDKNGVSSGFEYSMGNDCPAKDAIEESNQWYQEKIVNCSLDRNATCSSRAVMERFRYTFRYTGGELKRIT
jgi:hypothetical protein